MPSSGRCFDLGGWEGVGHKADNRPTKNTSDEARPLSRVLHLLIQSIFHLASSLALVLCSLALASCAPARSIMLVSTTSTENSGLSAHSSTLYRVAGST